MKQALLLLCMLVVTFEVLHARKHTEEKMADLRPFMEHVLAKMSKGTNLIDNNQQ